MICQALGEISVFTWKVKEKLVQ